MADVKVSALTALTGANLANGDQFLVTDVGSPNVSKSITADELAQGSQFSSRYKPLASDVVWLPATTLVPENGSTLTSFAIVNYVHAAILFDQTTVEYAIGNFHIPPSWNTADVDVLWTHASPTATGAVKWNWFNGSIGSDGNDIDQRITANDGTVTTTAGTRGILKVSRLKSGAALTSGAYWTYIYREAADGADTFNADAALLGVRLTRAS
jgi:hypothetical protein